MRIIFCVGIIISAFLQGCSHLPNTNRCPSGAGVSCEALFKEKENVPEKLTPIANESTFSLESRIVEVKNQLRASKQEFRSEIGELLYKAELTDKDGQALGQIVGGFNVAYDPLRYIIQLGALKPSQAVIMVDLNNYVIVQGMPKFGKEDQSRILTGKAPDGVFIGEQYFSFTEFGADIRVFFPYEKIDTQKFRPVRDDFGANIYYENGEIYFNPHLITATPRVSPGLDASASIFGTENIHTLTKKYEPHRKALVVFRELNKVADQRMRPLYRRNPRISSWSFKNVKMPEATFEGLTKENHLYTLEDRGSTGAVIPLTSRPYSEKSIIGKIEYEANLYSNSSVNVVSPDGKIQRVNVDEILEIREFPAD